MLNRRRVADFVTASWVRQRQGTPRLGHCVLDYKEWLLIFWQAVGVVPAEGEKGGVTLITKKTKHVQRPGSNYHRTTFGANKTTRKCGSPSPQKIIREDIC